MDSNTDCGVNNNSEIIVSNVCCFSAALPATRETPPTAPIDAKMIFVKHHASFKCDLSRSITVQLFATVLLSYFSSPGVGSSVHNSSQSENRVCCDIQGKIPIYFLTMAPYPDSPPFNPSWEGGPAVVPAALVAKDYINQRDDILPDYEVDFLIMNSGCNIVLSARQSLVSSVFHSGKNVVGVIGPGCSEAALGTAPLLINERISLIQIAPTATSPLLTNVLVNPNTFRPIVSALGVVQTFIEIIKFQNHEHVGAVYEAEREFQAAVYTHFEANVQKIGVRISSIGLFNTSIPISEFLFKIRVIFVFASTGFARVVLCLASKLGILYPDYQLIFSNRLPSNFMTNVTFYLDGKFYSCPQAEMEKATIGVVFNNFRLTRQDRDYITDAGISYNEFSKEYLKARDRHLESIGLTSAITTEHHSNYFDATWALALALNNSLPRLEEKGLSLSTYHYGMPEVTRVVREELLKLSFEGMRGTVEFNENTLDGANVTVIDISQVLHVGNNITYGSVGYFDPSMDKPLILYPNSSLIQAKFDQKYITPHLSLGIIAVIIIAILFVVLLACHIANVAWANYRTVKATSPNMNHLIFSSCYLCLVGAVIYTNAFVFVSVSDKSQVLIPVQCSALQWAGTLSYSLLFGTLCAKRWRVYRIFSKFVSSPLKRLSDNILISIALTPLLVDTVLNILWNIIDPWSFSVDHGPAFETLVSCKTNNPIVWATCLAVPKGVLTLIVLYLAIATRRVHKREFKQTKSINILIYSLLIMIGILLPLFLILRQTILPWAISVSYVGLCVLYIGPVVLCIVHVLLPPLIQPMKVKMLEIFPSCS